MEPAPAEPAPAEPTPAEPEPEPLDPLAGMDATARLAWAQSVLPALASHVTEDPAPAALAELAKWFRGTASRKIWLRFSNDTGGGQRTCSRCIGIRLHPHADAMAFGHGSDAAYGHGADAVDCTQPCPWVEARPKRPCSP